MLGFHVTVLEDRPLFANHARSAGADLVICDNFANGLEQIRGDKNTYYVLAVSYTHLDVYKRQVLPALIHQAKEAVAHGRNQNCHFLFSQEISKDMLSDRLHTSPEIQALVHPAVKYLLSLDNASQGKKHYLDTLKTYLLSGANLSLSAKKLHLHRNTPVSYTHLSDFPEDSQSVFYSG